MTNDSLVLTSEDGGERARAFIAFIALSSRSSSRPVIDSFGLGGGGGKLVMKCSFVISARHSGAEKDWPTKREHILYITSHHLGKTIMTSSRRARGDGLDQISRYWFLLSPGELDWWSHICGRINIVISFVRVEQGRIYIYIYGDCIQASQVTNTKG